MATLGLQLALCLFSVSGWVGPDMAEATSAALDLGVGVGNTFRTTFTEDSGSPILLTLSHRVNINPPNPDVNNLCALNVTLQTSENVTITDASEHIFPTKFASPAIMFQAISSTEIRFVKDETASPSATLNDWIAQMRSVEYRSTADEPSPVNREVLWALQPCDGNTAEMATATTEISIDRRNDHVPILILRLAFV